MNKRKNKQKENKVIFSFSIQFLFLTVGIWDSSIGDIDLEVKHEEKEHDQFTIGISTRKKDVEIVPKNFSKVFYQFLSLAGCTIEVRFRGKGVNRAGG